MLQQNAMVEIIQEKENYYKDTNKERKNSKHLGKFKLEKILFYM
jgi:hypothetical protein